MIKRGFQITLLVSIILASFGVLLAKEWRGIVPLYSTKSDADRMLGKPLSDSEFSAVYSLPDEMVEIDFSTKSNYQDCVKALPAGIVLKINVVPKTKLNLSALITSKKGYEKIDPSSFSQLPDGGFPKFLIGDEGYINDEEGIVVRGYKGDVLAVFYYAATKDRKLCESYYENSEQLGTVIFDFIDTSRNLRKSASDDDIQIEVDRCLISINQSPLVNCVVVNHGTEKEVSARTARIIKAIKHRKFDVRRFKFLRGENKSPLATKIFSFPIGMEPPLFRSNY